MANIKSNTYSIIIGENSLPSLNKFITKKNYSKYIIICDDHTLEKCLPTLLFHCPKLHEAEIIELESGEDKKNINTCIQVWGALTDIVADKKSLIINLGGGVVTDLGGFVASTFKRGVEFINIPTTLLAMVDASVGGKTGIDFEGIKNHIGSTQNPQAIYINPEFLKTLDTRQIKNGYAEIIKIALIADKVFWNKLKKLKEIDEFYTEEIITKAIELKNKIVLTDFYEQHLRKSLNFGHSIGHALESALIQQQKDILHGEAVIAGMYMESMIAHALKLISVKEKTEIQDYLKRLFKPISISKKTQQSILHYITHDKKNEAGKLCFSLPKPIGKFQLYNDVAINLIEEAINAYIKLK